MTEGVVLDLFSSGGGAGMGYKRAGFKVKGIDKIKRQGGYPPGDFIQGDVLDYLNVDFLRQFILVHASPPCQPHTRAVHLRNAQGNSTSKVNLIPEVRAALLESGVPFVIENVEGAPLRNDLTLCGSHFDLHVYDETGKRWLKRHRVFEIEGFTVPQPTCDHTIGVRPLGVYSSKGDNIPSGGQTARTLEEGRALMGIDWMSWAGLVEAIPPAYTEYIGQHFRSNHAH